MDKRDLVLTALEKYTTHFSQESKFIPQMISFMQQNPDCFERTNQKGHFTGSAWLFNPTMDKVLLTHHKKLNCWYQLGGHADGQSVISDVAMREAFEESGIDGIKLLSPDIFDIDIHVIPENLKKGEPEHNHYNLTYLCQAPTEDFVVSNESIALKWVTLPELVDMACQGDLTNAMMRRMNKWRYGTFG